MNKVKRRHANKFTTVDNCLINDYSIPPMARFLYIFLSCQSNDFQFNNPILCKALDCKDATLRKYMKVLLDAGLVERERQMVGGRKGYFDYCLNDPTTCQKMQGRKSATSQKNDLAKNDRSYNKEEKSNNNPLTPKGESVNDSEEKQSVGEIKNPTAAQDREAKAEKSLAFFNDYTGKNLTRKTYVKDFSNALKRGATAQDIAAAIYEQEYNTRKDPEARSKYLTPSTICREKNLARLADRWMARKKDEQTAICFGAPKYQSESSTQNIPWKDWPQREGWKKSTTPGFYHHNALGSIHYSKMIENRQARPSMFPNLHQFAA